MPVAGIAVRLTEYRRPFGVLDTVAAINAAVRMPDRRCAPDHAPNPLAASPGLANGAAPCGLPGSSGPIGGSRGPRSTRASLVSAVAAHQTITAITAHRTGSHV